MNPTLEKNPLANFRSKLSKMGQIHAIPMGGNSKSKGTNLVRSLLKEDTPMVTINQIRAGGLIPNQCNTKPSGESTVFFDPKHAPDGYYYTGKISNLKIAEYSQETAEQSYLDLGHELIHSNRNQLGKSDPSTDVAIYTFRTLCFDYTFTQRREELDPSSTVWIGSWPVGFSQALDSTRVAFGLGGGNRVLI